MIEFLQQAVPEFLEHLGSASGSERFIMSVGFMVWLSAIAVIAFYLWVHAYAVVDSAIACAFWRTVIIVMLVIMSFASVQTWGGIARWSPDLIWRRSTSGFLFVVTLFTVGSIGLLILSVWGSVVSFTWRLRGKRHPLWGGVR